MTKNIVPNVRGAIVLVALCDLGARYGKGAEFQSILRAFEVHANECDVVGIFRDRNDYQGPFRIKQALFLGNLFFRSIVLLERLAKKVGVRFSSRQVQDAVFDWLAALQLPKNICVLMTLPGMTSTLKRAKELGATTVLHGVVMHPQFNQDILKRVFPDEVYPSVWAAGMVDQANRSMVFFDHVICPSSTAARSYLENGFRPGQVSVVPLGFESHIAPQEIKSWSAGGKIRVLYVGNITRMKGCDILLDTVKKLDPNRFEFHFVGDIQSDIELECADLARRNNVIFHGQRPSLEMYPNCHVLVLMSLSEGLARVIIESGTFGLLVVTNQWVHGDLVVDGESGIICEQDADTLARVLDHIEKHRSNMTGLRHGLQDRCRQLTWERFGEGVRLTLARLCNERAAH